MSAVAIIHSLVSPASLANILLHVVMLSSFVAVFFFVYGSKVEQNVVKKQTNAIVDSFTGDIKNIVPQSQLDKLKPYLDQYLVAPDMQQADADAKKKNHDLMMKTVKILGIINGIAIALIIILWCVGKFAFQGKYYFSGWKLLRDNLITLAFVAVTEFFFLTVIAQNYKSADPNTVKLAIVNTLQNYAKQ